MFNDPKIIGIAFLGGIIPALLWLWFWIKEEEKHAEPKKILALVFLMGMISVIFVLPVQKFIQGAIGGENAHILLWASAEEIFKYLAVIIVLYRTSYIDQPIDWPIYLITAALGFAALENALFLVKPLSLGQDAVSLLTGQLRFLGSTLLHAVTSGILGIALGISMHMKWLTRKFYLLAGLLLAIALHSIFNFFIIRNSGNGFLKVFAFLWIAAVIVILLFEKLRRMD